MKKTHLAYLERGIKIALSLRASSAILAEISKQKCGNVPIYGLIRDIVTDSRFYTVTEYNRFWRLYSLLSIYSFIESVTPEMWEREDEVTALKETFLNEWFINHIFPLSDEEKNKRFENARSRAGLPEIKGYKRIEVVEADDEGDEETYQSDPGVFDCTDIEDRISESTLPYSLKAYSRQLNNSKGSGDGSGQQHSAEASFLLSIDQEIVRLAELIGRSGGFEDEPSGSFLRSSKSDICGITVGSDINSVMPSELALLSDRATENIFFQRYAQKRLQVFASASHSTKKTRKKKGAIFMCVDSSGSMYGEPEKMAKKLALAVAIVAQRNKRPLVLINYSGTLSFFVVQDLKKQKRRLMAFLSCSYGGGNNETRLFRFVFKGLAKTPQYRQLSERFEGADLLVISDFEWCPIANDVRALLQENKEKGMRFFGVSTREIEGTTRYDFDEDLHNGEEFFNACDFRYIYSEDGSLRPAGDLI